ncbi:PBS lyase HEAT-like repeat protein [Caulifigura coniformis]|uniref:PBS lyase HEAT-like repeat protein n=1 Tax=Caulifigura coniformis TaxID=2527983 RepID=A0A517SH59_9PLAN|nr:HEAT repeat domain-containing protein [Caulifigura coniformis]QDT55460.1 PBS lyase HEAT-like repeat protein [Caulifigura coniformis]
MRRELFSLSIALAFTGDLYTQSLFAQDGANAAKPVEPSSAKMSTSDLLRRFENAEYAWQQAQIADVLVIAGDRSILPRIAQLTRVSDRKRRCNAAFVLDGLGDARGMAILVAELRDTRPRAVNPEEKRGNGGAERQAHSDRHHCAHLLGRIGRDEAIPTLIELLKDEELCDVAASSLGNLGVSDAMDDLVVMADAFPQHRDSAASALAKLGDARGLEMLSEIVTSNLHESVRLRATDALRESGSLKQQPVLLQALADPHPNVRVAAVRALNALGDARSLPGLRIASQDESVPPWHAPTTVSAEAIAAIEAIERRDQQLLP